MTNASTMTAPIAPPKELASLPVFDFDPYSDAHLLDPFPRLDEIRNAGSVVWLSHIGVPGLARHAEVQAALRDWETFSSAAGAGLDDLRHGDRWRPRSMLLETDPPQHGVGRNVMNSVLSMAAARRMKESFEANAKQIVEELVEKREFDAVEDLAARFVLKVFPDAVGIGPDGRENLLPWGDMVFNSFGPRNERFADSARRAEVVRRWVYETATRPNVRAGSFGSEIYDAVDQGRITEEEGVILVGAMLTAGLDTTVTALSASMLAFARFPSQWDVLRAQPQLKRQAFDEVVRWASPVQTFFRTTTRSVEVGGHAIPSDTKILLFLGGANRDPAKFPSPERLDIERAAGGHVGFGFGIHQCVGQMIAKAEAEALFDALISRVARIELTGEPSYHLNNTVRAYHRIPVRIHPN